MTRPPAAMSGYTRRRWSLLALVLVLLLPATVAIEGSRAAAQEFQPGDLNIDVTVDRSEMTIGDHVVITVRTHHPENVLITIDEPLQVEDIDLISSDTGTTVTDDSGSATTTARFVIAPFALGPLQPGDVTVSWLTEDSQTGTERVPSPSIEVIPVRAPDDTALRPLKPQATIDGAPPAWIRPAAVAGAGVGALTVAVAGAVLWRRRRAAGAPAPVLPDMSAEADARRRLDMLAAPTSLDERDFQYYYGTLSLIVREYLERRFEFKATALTTRELDERMGAEGIDRWQARLVTGLLGRCDAAVYARLYPDPTSANDDLTVAYEIVEIARPRPRAVEAVPS